MSRHLSARNISSKSMHAFLSNLTNRQTDRQTDKQTDKKHCVQSHLPPPLSEVINIWCNWMSQMSTCMWDRHLAYLTAVILLVNKHCGRGGSSLPTGLRLGWPRAVQGPTFKTPLPRSFVPRPMPCVMDVCPAVSEPYGFENVDITQTNRRTHGQTNIWPVL